MKSSPADQAQCARASAGDIELRSSIPISRRLVAERRIPFHRLGRLIRFKKADLDAFIEAGRVEAFDPNAVRQHLRRAS